MDHNTHTLSSLHTLHLAIVMDGNGRWAKAQKLPRIEGHRKGALVAKNLIKPIHDLHAISHLTLFAFSTENWKRDEEEVSTLMLIFEEALSLFINEHSLNPIRFRMIGNRHNLPPSLLFLIEKAEDLTKNNQGMTLHLALNYGGHDDITSAAQHFAHLASLHKISPLDINQELFENHLQNHSAPPADIILRTGGEKRLSNFLLWQAAYSELFFIDTFWPDVTIDTIKNTLQLYKKRERRYGNTA